MQHRTSCGCEKNIGSSKCHIPHYCEHGQLFLYTKALGTTASANRSAPRKPRKAMKRSKPDRDWVPARAKVDEEEICRVCGGNVQVQAAHIIGEDRDKFDLEGNRRSGVWIVEPVRIIPLCGPVAPLHCHPDYDAHELDVLQFLTLPEQIQAVADAGSLVTAHRRTAPKSFQILAESPSRAEGVVL